SNGGQASAFNAGFAVATGDVIFMLDADDRFFPAKLPAIMPLYENFEIGWCHDRAHSDSAMPGDYGANRLIDARAGMRRGAFPILPVPTSALSFRRELLAQILPMPVADGVTLSDNYLKFAAAFLAPGLLLGQALTFQRLHENNRYTDKPDVWQLRAGIMRATGYALASRYPALKRLGLELVAGGLSDSRLPQAVIRDYLDKCVDTQVFGANARLRCVMLVAKKKMAHAVRATLSLSKTDNMRAEWQN
ncbi:MAG TPA: glycosyltransferase, partial [Rhizomicrobium sp.]|nr:glycosyltransferase [Rhizomicrobium sp.]